MPLPHRKHAALVGDEMVPSSHCTHWAMPDCGATHPGKQGAQLLSCGLDEADPTEHGRHASRSGDTMEPGGHELHFCVPAVRAMLPAGQGKQVPLRASATKLPLAHS